MNSDPWIASGINVRKANDVTGYVKVASWFIGTRAMLNLFLNKTLVWRVTRHNTCCS